MNLVAPSDPILFTPARPVTDEDLAMHGETIKALTELMLSKGGACLSAPQVGLGLALFVSKFPSFPVAINPSFYAYGDGYTSKPEGSLTRPGWSTFVRRPNQIRAIFLQTDGTAKELHLDGIEARCFAHACDYLSGTPIFPRPLRAPVPA